MQILSRRGFICALSALAVVPFVPRRVSDSARLQALFDRGLPIPKGEYWLTETLDLRGRYMQAEHSIYRGTANPLILIDDTARGSFSYNTVIYKSGGTSFYTPPAIS